MMLQVRPLSKGLVSLLLVGAGFLLEGPGMAEPLNGQVPGQRIPTRERVHAEYINNIMDGITEGRERWVAGVSTDDLEALMESYAPDAMLVPPGGGPLYGKDAIRSFWQTTLPSLGRIQTALADMDASGQMAMIAGTYTLERQGETGGTSEETGGLLTVFVQVGREWFIRGQVFGAGGF